MNRFTPITSIALLLAGSACSPHKVTTAPAPPVDVSGEFSSAGAAPLPDTWWKDFGDATLDRLVDEVIASNFQLAGAWARLRQAEALASAAGAGRYPQLDLSANASRRKIFNNFAQLDPTGMTASSFTQNNYSVSLAAGYEIDIWKKMSNQTQAAVVDARGARSDLEALAMSLVAEVAETWFDLLHQRSQRALLSEQVALNQSLLELVELRFEGGLSSALEVLQQRQQLIATRSRLVNVDASEERLRHRLAVLTGKPPRTAVTKDEALAMPGLPQLPSVGLPADLLVRRPDVRAARDRVVAADFRVAVAIANRLPSLRIGGSLDLQSATLGDLIGTPLWSIFGSLAAPLFDGFRRKAEADRQKAVVSERLATFGQVLLSAMAEVEGAISSEKHQLRLIAELEEQLAVSSDNLDEAQSRYEKGIAAAGFLDVLAALQAKQAVELNLLGARRALISQRVSLCRALGGSWSQDLSAPKPLELQSEAQAKGQK